MASYQWMDFPQSINQMDQTVPPFDFNVLHGWCMCDLGPLYGLSCKDLVISADMLALRNVSHANVQYESLFHLIPSIVCYIASQGRVWLLCGCWPGLFPDYFILIWTPFQLSMSAFQLSMSAVFTGTDIKSLSVLLLEVTDLLHVHPDADSNLEFMELELDGFQLHDL